MTKTKIKPKAHHVPFYRRPIIWVMFVVVIVIAITALAILRPEPNQEDSPDAIDTTQSVPTCDNTPTEVDIQSEVSSDQPASTPQYEGENANHYDDLSGHIAYQYLDETSSTLTIMVNIDQYITGTCKLIVYQDNQEKYQDTLAANPDVTTSVCGPFRVPTSKLHGDYTYQILVKSNEKTGTIPGEFSV